MTFGLLEEHAIERERLPAGWRAYRWEAFPKNSVRLIYSQLTGGVPARLISRGPRKGSPDWSKIVPGTKREVVITPEEHRAWLTEWEKRTGKCCHCRGEAKVMESWSVSAGTTYRPCQRCNGTGKNPETPIPAVP
jgi:hypothetical protein